MFIDGTELDRYFETAEGTIWISGLIEIRNGNLLLRRLLVYPTTGAKLPVGTPSMLEIVRSLKEEAIAQGTVCLFC